MMPLLAAVLLAAATPAIAADAETLFDRGQFAAAADTARAVDSPASLTLAARATLVVAAYEVDDKRKALMLIDEAEGEADRALSLAPGNVNATLQKAIAIGYRAKLKRSPGLARDARDLMEVTARRAPKSALAWASIGGWHGESIADLGKFIAGTMVGAKSDTCIESYERALALDPASPVFRTLYAITLVGIGKAEPAKLRALLSPAAGARGGDGFEQLMRARARALLAALDSGRKGALKAAAERAKPFANLD